MKRILTTLAMAMVFIVAYAVKKENLSILYIGGMPDLETISEEIPATDIDKSIKNRMNSFDKFLRSRFKKVKTIRVEQYSADMSAGYDVTVFDCPPNPHNRTGNGMVDTILTDDFSAATLCIGTASNNMTRIVGCRNDWFCKCLNHYAFNWNKNHPIFNGPFEVNITTEMRPLPHHAAEELKKHGKECPELMEMWQVSDTARFDSDGHMKMPGMICRGSGYDDSPDSEYISGGESAKTYESVAIGRHGNYFHWGFCANPEDLTEQGRNVLANAIVYISKFKGQHLISRKIHEDNITREQMLENLEGSIGREFWQITEGWHANYRRILTERGQEITADALPRTYPEFVREHYPEIYDVIGPNLEEYKHYFTVNLPYVYPDINRHKMLVDRDCRELGVANNDIAMLDSAITVWERGGKQAVMGRRMLNRYTLCRFDTPAEYREWFDKYRDKLFFTESGGFLWLVNSFEPDVVGNDYDIYRREMEARENGTYVEPSVTSDNKNVAKIQNMLTSVDEPVALEAAVTTDGNGDRYFTVTMMIHPGFHAYATVDPSESLIQTTIEMEFPAGITSIGEMSMPDAVPTGSGTTHYEGLVTFSRRFTGCSNGEMKANIRYQVCDNSGCRMPRNVTVTAQV